jgi:signal transduction histidine kinase
MTVQTVEAFLKRSMFRYAGVGLFTFALISVSVAFVLARLRTSSNLELVARAAVSAFHDQIVEGDARGAEVQIQTMLHLYPSEVAWLLKGDRDHIYQPAGQPFPVLESCPVAGVTCLRGLFGPARIFEPVFFGKDQSHLFGYLYIERQVRLDWFYLITVFLSLTLGGAGLGLCMMGLVRIGVSRVGLELSEWSARLKSDPKSAKPLDMPPFLELVPLKEAIEGLRGQIEALEKEAGYEAKLLVLRGIAHDILTPVSQLQLRVATLELKIRGSGHEGLLSHIRESLYQVSSIATQVKHLKEELPPPDGTDLIAATEAEVELIRQTDGFVSKKINLQIKVCDGPLPTPFSRGEISRIVGNLVGNAAYASRKGSSIMVEIGRDDGLAFLKVQDQGCGVPAAYCSKVFDPEFTLKPGTSTGLGLAIVRFLCDQRKAHVNLESLENVGTTVTIRVALLGI